MEGEEMKKIDVPHWVEVVSKYEEELSRTCSGEEKKSRWRNESHFRNGLYNVMFRRLKELEVSSPSGIIRFPAVFEKLCRNFSISKQECWELLFLLRDSGFIELVPYQGVRFLHQV